MKGIKIFFILAAAVSAVECMSAQKSLYKLEVGDFSELKVTDGVNVEYVCSTDSAGWAYFECDPGMADNLMFTNKNSKLNIQLATFEGEKPAGLPTIKVYSMTLQKVVNSGDSTVRIIKALPVRDFKVTIVGNGTIVVNDINCHKVAAAINTGNGHMVINGVTSRASLKNVGAGTLEASGLQAEEVKCNVLGTGSIDCNASVSLTVSGAGSGKVYYGGTPSKISNRSIGVKAYSMDNKQEIN